VGEAENLIALGALLRPPEHRSGKRKKIIPLSVFENPANGSHYSSGRISFNLMQKISLGRFKHTFQIITFLAHSKKFFM
jgi:hypothetical protein